MYVRVPNFLQWISDTSGVYPAGDLTSQGTQCDETFDSGLFGSPGLTPPQIAPTQAVTTDRSAPIDQPTNAPDVTDGPTTGKK